MNMMAAADTKLRWIRIVQPPLCAWVLTPAGRRGSPAIRSLGTPASVSARNALSDRQVLVSPASSTARERLPPSGEGTYRRASLVPDLRGSGCIEEIPLPWDR